MLMRERLDFVGLIFAAASLFFAAGFALKARIDRTMLVASSPKMLPLGIIPAGHPLPAWAAKYSRGVTAGMDLIGEIDANSGVIVLKPLRRLVPFCGGYLDPLDASPGNRFIPCQAMINISDGGSLLNGINLDGEGDGVTAYGLPDYQQP